MNPLLKPGAEGLKTRDGRDVRIYATDGSGIYPIHGAIKLSDGWQMQQWCDNGSFLYRTTPHYSDIMLPEPWQPSPEFWNWLPEEWEKSTNERNFYHTLISAISKHLGIDVFDDGTLIRKAINTKDARIAELEQQNTTLNGNLAATIKHCVSIEAERDRLRDQKWKGITQLEQQLAEARKDSERLDWVLDCCHCDYWGKTVNFTINSREAIDAAKGA